MQGPVPVELSISLDKLGYIIVKAREFDAKVDPVEPDPGSNPADEGEREVLEDYADDETGEELSDAIENLNEDELTDLLAIVWVGRGDYDAEDWEAARAAARDARDERSARSLMGTPNLGDEIEEGLATLGFAYPDIEEEHL